MEPKTLPKPHEHDDVVTGDPKIDLPPYEGEGEDPAAKLYGMWAGLLPDLSLEDFRQMRDEWAREGLDDLEDEHPPADE